jgi:hypothetical protein
MCCINQYVLYQSICAKVQINKKNNFESEEVVGGEWVLGKARLTSLTSLIKISSKNKYIYIYIDLYEGRRRFQ